MRTAETTRILLLDDRIFSNAKQILEISPLENNIFPQTVCLTLGVLTVMVKGRVARSRWRTEFVAIFVLSCLHVHFRRYLRTFRVAAVVGRGFCL